MKNLSVVVADDEQLVLRDLKELIEIAHHEFPDMKFLIITSCDEFDYAKRAIANGVRVEKAIYLSQNRKTSY